MEKFRVNAIAAIGKNRELGKNNNLIWKLDADFEHMKETVAGHPLIMGRSTYESIGREPSYSPCIVLTRSQTYEPPYKNTTHTHIAHDLDEALKIAQEISDSDEAFIFGGEKVYTEALPHVQRLYLTEIDASAEADTFFPEYAETHPLVVSESAGEEEGIAFKMRTLEK